ncbi:MAG: hypothetical protein HS123_04495 [Solibacteraceae bacterium]|nr:hypothetical protein [Solibacteraceae bacterium]
MKRVLAILMAAGLALLLLAPAADYAYKAGGGGRPVRGVTKSRRRWRRGRCRRTGACVATSATDSTMMTNLRRVGTHWTGEVPARPRMRHADVLAMTDRCRSCHQQEYAQWRNGPHSVTFEALFLDKKHNSERILMDDCFRCHGCTSKAGSGIWFSR